MITLRGLYRRLRGRVELMEDPMPVNKKSFQAIAHALAESHKLADPGTHSIYLVPDPKQEEVRLVEVSKTAPTTDEVFPIYFEAQSDIELPSGVVLLSDEEWEKVQKGQLHLPDGWGAPGQLEKLA
jgi:hypothetical protein